MTYTKYHTQGIVLKKFDRGEADQVYAIFTREAGILYAHAQGVRKVGSKLRGGLQVGTVGTFSFIRARVSWRVTHASASVLAGTRLAQQARLNEVFGRLARLVMKLVPREEPQIELFDVFAHALRFIVRYELRDDDIENLEALLALRVLYTLGYVGKTKQFGYLLASPFVTDVFLAEAARVRQGALVRINRALREL